jgi:putative pyruvate formate lyase activating enzyme
MEVVGRNHKMAWQAGEVIIRHLVLPNHVECCSKPLLKWISQNLGLEVVLNIMGQYHPVYNVQEYEEISRLPFSSEIWEVVQYARNLGFNNLI